MKTLKQYWQMIRQTHGDRLLMGFVVFYFLDCLLLWLTDPAISNYGDALWLGFNIFTSIGLGDYTVSTLWARIAAVLLGLYGAVIAASIPGLVASYYLDRLQTRRKNILDAHHQELSHLSQMSDDEKRRLSAQIRKENNQS